MSITKDQLVAQMLSVFEPTEDASPIDWMAENCKVLPGVVGSFDPTHTPWLRGPIQATFDPATRSIVNLAAVGTGKSIYICIVTAYIIAKAPADILVYQPTNPNAKDFFRNTLYKVWSGCPPVAKLIPQGKDVTWSCQVLDRATVWTLGADAEANLQRYHTKWVMIDEAWKVAQKKGHIKQAKARNLSFGWLGKTVLTGQAGLTGDDFDLEWEQSTKEEYSWICPHCKTVQPWSWDSIKLPEGGLTAEGLDEELISKGTRMACKGCDATFEDNDQVRYDLNQASIQLPGHGYVRTNFKARDSNRGFRWNCLPARSWGETAIEWAKAKLAQTNGDETPMMLFRQKNLAQPYSTEIMDSTDEIAPGAFKLREAWEEEAGFSIEDREIVPTFIDDENHIPLRFMGVDVQRDGFYALVRSYASDGRSRLFDWGYFSTIEEVDQFRRRCRVSPPFSFIDSGDQQDFVFRSAAKLGWTCTRGHRKNEYPWPTKLPDGTVKVKHRPFSKPRDVEPYKGAITRVYYFGNLPFKDLLWRLRRSGIHQYPLDAGEEYRKQMSSERRTKTASGIPVWKAPAKRANHLWDCETILMLPALFLGLAGEAKETQGQVTQQNQVDQPAQEDEPVD